MIDEVPDRHQLCELNHTASMIGMIVREHQMIDLREPRVASGGQNPLRIACGLGGAGGRLKGARAARKAGVNQKSFASGCFDQCRLAALDIHKVDDEGARRRLRRKGRARQEDGGQKPTGTTDHEALFRFMRIGTELATSV